MKIYVSLAACMLLTGSAYAQGAPEGGAAGLIKSLDKNSDGLLSKEEVASTPIAGDFDKIDTNKDGKLSAEELEAFAKAGGGGPGGGGNGSPPQGSPPAAK